MGLFDFFRKKEKPPEIEKTSFSELEIWLENRKRILRSEKENILLQIKERVSSLSSNIAEKSEVLEKIDLSKKKEMDKLKIIVKENLLNYNSRLSNLISNLQDLEDSDPNALMEKIYSQIADFEKSSNLSYQKATILVGRELDDIRIAIRNFIKSLKSLGENNKDTLLTYKTIISVESELIEIKKSEDIRKQFSKKISNNDETIKSLEKQIESINEKIIIVKKSNKFKDIQERKEKLGKNKELLEKAFFKLKGNIDFKKLGKIYHSNKKKMTKLQQFKENFIESFEKDKGESLNSLLTDSNTNSDLIRDNINNIIKMKKEIAGISLDGDETIELKLSINKLKNNIQEITDYSLKEKKRNQKFNSNEMESKNKIIEEMEKIDVTVEL